MDYIDKKWPTRPGENTLKSERHDWLLEAATRCEPLADTDLSTIKLWLVERELPSTRRDFVHEYDDLSQMNVA